MAFKQGALKLCHVILGNQIICFSKPRLMTFHGLKLNTMSYIKEEAKKQHINVKETDFIIRITVEDMEITTRSFKIVSSFSQLPKDMQIQRNSRLKL